MKTQYLTALLVATVALGAGAQTLSIVSKDRDLRVWQVLSQVLNERGEIIQQETRIREIQTGLHFWDPDTAQYVESSEEIEMFPAGCVARRGPLKLILAKNIRTAGAINILLPDGQELNIHPIGLAYYSPLTGQSVLIAETQESSAELIPPNQVIYRNCFADNDKDTDNIKADCLIAYTKSGVCQDIVFRESPLDPAEYGLDDAGVQLQVNSELVDSPALDRRYVTDENTNQVPYRVLVAPGLGDEQLSLGEVIFGNGRAFTAGDEGIMGENSVPVGKSWVTTPADGRSFLIEGANYQSLKPKFQTLPQAAKPNALRSDPKKPWRTVQAGPRRVFPPAPPVRFAGAAALRASGGKGSGVRMAQNQSQPQSPALGDRTSARDNRPFAGPGVVVDWQLLLSNTNAMVLDSASTWYVSGTVNLSGMTVLEAGTVIKYTNDLNARICILGGWECRTTPYRPAIATSKDDNTVGVGAEIN